MHDTRAMLRHLLATLAYRTQKALRDAPVSFGTFEAGAGIRTPGEIVRHMTAVMNYARSCFDGRPRAIEPLTDLQAEVERFHAVLAEVSAHLAAGTAPRGDTEAQLLQGPFADALTHAGQLALLRRLAGAPVPAESFVAAAIDAANVGMSQPAPARPKLE
jgi:hypothetical protein